AHKPTFGEPAGQLWCAIVLERERKGGKAQKKVAAKTTFHIIIPTDHREEIHIFSFAPGA
ncbi:MAG: hypothetical protein IKW15_08070, partial [Bacteroidales bacterium]|nr:hypothetical protein [Bacteroidales bacterium]